MLGEEEEYLSPSSVYTGIAKKKKFPGNIALEIVSLPKFIILYRNRKQI